MASNEKDELTKALEEAIGRFCLLIGVASIVIALSAIAALWWIRNG